MHVALLDSLGSFKKAYFIKDVKTGRWYVMKVFIDTSAGGVAVRGRRHQSRIRVLRRLSRGSTGDSSSFRAPRNSARFRASACEPALPYELPWSPKSQPNQLQEEIAGHGKGIDYATQFNDAVGGWFVGDTDSPRSFLFVLRYLLRRPQGHVCGARRSTMLKRPRVEAYNLTDRTCDFKPVTCRRGLVRPLPPHQQFARL